MTTPQLTQFQNQGLGLSVISLAELYTGIYHSANPIKARNGLHDFLSLVTVPGVNEQIGRIFGEENARLRQDGQIIQDFDLLIAATCIHHNLKLLTNNRRHFQRIVGLEVISSEF